MFPSLVRLMHVAPEAGQPVRPWAAHALWQVPPLQLWEEEQAWEQFPQLLESVLTLAQ